MKDMEPNHVVSAADLDARPRGDERLAIRKVTANDVEKLAALYDTLDRDDRHNRFFGHYRPPHALIERIATVGDRGGAGLVAAVLAPDGTERQLEGEVGYTLLDDRNGELAITVTPRWRGWLGPYLLDAVRADRGGPRRSEPRGRRVDDGPIDDRDAAASRRGRR